jgi:hypothetical protein
MPDGKALEKRTQVLLGEFRILVPALAALLGFQLIAGMQKTYEELAPTHRAVNFVGVLCTLVAFGFMLVPSAYHRLWEEADQREEFVRLARRCLSIGFAFLTVSLSLALFLQAARSFSNDVGATIAAVGALVFFGLAWWVFPHWRAHGHAPSLGEDEEPRLAH